MPRLVTTSRRAIIALFEQRVEDVKGWEFCGGGDANRYSKALRTLGKLFPYHCDCELCGCPPEPDCQCYLCNPDK